MITITIDRSEEGRKLGRYLSRILPKAPQSFLYKALRQNKIKIDRKKPKDLSLVLVGGNQLSLYFTDEQLSELGYKSMVKKSTRSIYDDRVHRREITREIEVLYEDEQLLVVNKPIGILAQKSKPTDISLTEIAREYLQKKGKAFSVGFIPSFCHRLDRNTGGIMIMAKTLAASQAVSAMLKQRTLHKYYNAVVEGIAEPWAEKTHLIHTYEKDRNNNKAILHEYDKDQPLPKDVTVVESEVRLIKPLTDCSLVEIELLTGKSHQIRAQLSFEGYPIVGDGKYNQGAGGYHQMLFAYKVEFTECPKELAYLNHKIITAPLPMNMKKMVE